MARRARKEITSVAIVALSFLAGELPPTEFRIFAAGENQTRKGTYLFDDAAARQVMAAYEAHGTDLMLDLEHLSLEDPQTSVGFDPDARGWARLELRNGELWAVNVTWTPDGETRLREKRQRYISPAFEVDPKTRRITRLLNIAITALPATDNLAPLVAAAGLYEGDPMTAEQLSQIAEALGLGADANVEDVLATIAAMVKTIQDAANGTGDATAAEAPPEDAPAPMAAAARISVVARVIGRLTGKTDLSAALVEVEAWKKSHLELEAQRAALAAERATLEGSERRTLVAELVKLGAEIPATAWADDAATKPAEPWASMPIATLRARVAKLKAAKGTAARTDVRPPPTGSASSELTAEQIQICNETGCKPEVFSALRKVNAPITLRS